MNIVPNVHERIKKLYEVRFFPEVEADLDLLSDELLDEVDSYVEKLKVNPFKYSQPLQDIDGRDLRDYRKIYFANATYRIIIKVGGGITNIVEVVAIGERDKKKVYAEAFARITARSPNK